MDLQFRDVDQDAAGIVSKIAGVTGVAAHDHLVQGDLGEVRPSGDDDRPPPGRVVAQLVQVVDHQPVPRSARREVPAGHALLVPPHGVVGVGRGVALREVAANEVEAPAAVEVSASPLEDRLRGDGPPGLPAKDALKKE